MTNGFFQRGIHFLCQISSRYPGPLLFLFTLLTLPPALFHIQKIKINTNLDRLLPKTSPAAQWKYRLKSAVGDGGYFTLLFEGDDHTKLLKAVHKAREQVQNLAAVKSVEYRYPRAFIQRYRYLLIPSYYLEKIYDWLIGLESKISPSGLDIMSDDEEETYESKEDRKYLEQQLSHYGNLPEFHQSKDGTIMGLFIRPLKGVTSLGATRKLFKKLQKISDNVSVKYGLWSGVSGSLRNKIDEFDLITSDLSRSGIAASALILLILFWSFRSIVILPVLLCPLAFGLLWAFSLVPSLVGDLNTITSFILLVLFGMGIDYSIHLTKHFQLLLKNKKSFEALIDTYQSTGISVGVSGITTAFSLMILAVSDFRGFSEFGIIGGATILMVLLSTFLIMPSCLILGHRIGLVSQSSHFSSSSYLMLLPKKCVSLFFIFILLAFMGISFAKISFDYDFSNLKAAIPEAAAIKERHKKVYPTSMSPAALYVAKDFESLDKMLYILNKQKKNTNTKLGRIISIRDFAPDKIEARKRFDLIKEIQERVQGRWIRHIKDTEQKRWVDDLRIWTLPPLYPKFEDLPPAIQERYTTHDGSKRFLIGIFPNAERKNGKNAMAFTEELYTLNIPDGILGAVGETPIFAEILWLVTKEGPFLTIFSFLGIIILVYLNQRSFKDTCWILLPLICGFILTLGIMGAVNFKLNFFNIVVLPALLGMGVDNGVHFYCRWLQLKRDTRKTLIELWEPLTVCTLTTMMGYSGMVFASHPGLQSIGLLACLGLGCTWFTSLVLLPAFLEMKRE